MKVLVLDRDRDACEKMLAILTDIGAEAVFEPIKNKAMELVKEQDFDVILLDPSPQNEIRPFIMGVRRTLNAFPPVIVLSHMISHEGAMQAGANDLITKPYDVDNVVAKLRDAARIKKISRLMADESEDFPSKDGLIAKSAFNQLFITCLDHADRYAENSFLIFINIDNFEEIEEELGADAAHKVATNLQRILIRTRRTSDIAGHIKKAEFCLLLLRPAREGEPRMAAGRFADVLKENLDFISAGVKRAVLKVSLLEVPSGKVVFDQAFSSEENAQGSAG